MTCCRCTITLTLLERIDVVLKCCCCSRRAVVMTYWGCIVTLTLQPLTGVAFASLTLKWHRRCIWLVDLTMTHWRVDANGPRCCSQTKEDIYIHTHSGSLKELTVFTLLDSSAPSTHLLVQILVVQGPSRCFLHNLKVVYA